MLESSEEARRAGTRKVIDLVVETSNEGRSRALMRAVLTALIDELRRSPITDISDFRAILAYAPGLLGLQQQEFAAMLAVSSVTLQRWNRGDSVPFALTRKAIVEEIATIAHQRIQALGPESIPDEATASGDGRFALVGA